MPNSDDYLIGLQSNAFESLYDSIDAIERTVAMSHELCKQQMTFNDRLCLLAGGTLTLTFTALSVLLRVSTSSGHVKVLWSLGSAWIFLGITLVFSLLANQQMLTYMERQSSSTHKSLHEMRTFARRTLIYQFAQAKGAGEIEKPRIPENETQDIFIPIQRRSRSCGLVAQGSLFTAYVLLIAFFCLNTNGF